MAATAVNYQCPNCTAPLSFQPGHDKVTCEYCGEEFEVGAIEEMFRQREAMAAQAADARDAKWDTAAAGGDWDQADIDALKAFTCSSCGAEIVSDGNTMATECCYCGNPTMLPQRFEGMLKPDFVIPFKKTKEEAVAALKKFYEGRRLLPSAFTANNRVESIQAMYVPFWLFDTKTDAYATFRAEKVRVIETNNETITETKVYECLRSGSMAFERIPVDGSEKMDDTYMESIEPFDYREMVPFSTAYLTGYLADKYDVDAEQSAPRADKRVERSAVEVLEGTVTGYDHCTCKESSVAKEHGQVSYAMVPVWILTTKYEGKPYTFMMNGQTGKVVGSLPYDKGKAMMYALVTAVIICPIAYFIAKILLT
ncbi:MAG: hypothetical protein IJ849_07925 [Selenomonadaceae bacterium]|nr:hypothetical protein [Selenomonadaceae bacterium]